VEISVLNTHITTKNRQYVEEVIEMAKTKGKSFNSPDEVRTFDKGKNEIAIFPVVVGTKTDLYEVVAPNELRLAPGVKFQLVESATGKNSGWVLLRPNGETGGYMACGCVGAQTSSCVTVSDNPDHPSCSGGCTDSEGKTNPCELIGYIGPPKDPFRIRFLARPT
jgi:hypothetical protein